MKCWKKAGNLGRNSSSLTPSRKTDTITTLAIPRLITKKLLPRIAHHALAGVAAGDLRELALEGRRRRPAVGPFHLGGRGRQRRVMRLRRAVDDEGSARQRLEGGADAAVGIVIMRPGETA